METYVYAVLCLQNGLSMNDKQNDENELENREKENADELQDHTIDQ